MTKIAIIPARGGSKRLPRKNILQVSGKPALFYPIQAALKTGLFDRVIVSTEDEQIKKAALDCGAEVLERPCELARDRVGVVRVCQGVLEELSNEGMESAYFCCIYATAVFITPEDLEKSFLLMEASGDVRVVMGVSKFNLSPVQALELTENGYLKPKWPDYNGLQSQLHPDLVASNGTFYWAKTKAFLREKTFYGDKLKGYEIPWLRAIDMDTIEDYKNVEVLAPLLLNKNRGL
jgi:pseudaminic acid cytidylyltransferase